MRAVVPETVKHAITVAPVSCAARQAMAQVVSGKEAGIFAGSGVSQGWLRAEDSAARTRMIDHRVEHLGGDDDRNASAVGAPDDVFLDRRDFLGRNLYAQVSARNHHPIGVV